MRCREEWVLHEAGYAYTEERTISSLTMPERRRLLEGQRVDTKIQNMIREASDDVSAGQGSPSDALGRTIPRESDKDLLRDFEDRRQRGEL